MFQPAPPVKNLLALGTSQPGESFSVHEGGAAAGAVANKLESIRAKMAKLRVAKQELEKNIINCPNLALQQRFKNSLEEVERKVIQADEELKFSLCCPIALVNSFLPSRPSPPSQ